MTLQKVSIRIFQDREVRAVWDDDNSKWWFSVLDIVGVLNEQDNYEVVSATNQLKCLHLLESL